MELWKNRTGVLDHLEKGFYYEKLSSIQQKGYETVTNGIAAFQKRMQISDVSSKEEAEQIIRAVAMEQFQFFYANLQQISISQSGSQIFFSIEYIYDKKKTAELKRQIEEKADFILSQIIMDDMDDYEKCQAVHDYITENIRYNFSALSVSYVYDAFTVEGALLKKQAVCMGIAKGIAYLLNRLGIYNLIVCGSSDIDGNRINHAWNMARQGGNYYHIDATWDLQEINHFTNHSHMYFNLDDDAMLTNHFWELQDYPNCDSNFENYYVREKRFFRSIHSFELYVRQFLKEKQIYMDIKFEDTLDFADDGGEYVAGLIKKNANYLGMSFQISCIFNFYNYVFQAEITY